MQDSGLIRHLGKLKAIRDNAVAWQKLKAEVGDVGLWLWQVVDGQPLYRNVTDFRQAPAQTETSLALSKTLKIWFQICWTDDLLCFYAGSRYG